MPDDGPGVGPASRLTLAVFILLLVLGSAVQNLDFDIGMLITQWVLILIPSLWYLRRHRVAQRGFARMRMLEARYLRPILLLSLCTWILNAFFAVLVVTQLMRLGFEPVDVLPPPVTPWDFLRYLFLIGVSAGVCEEILFRSAVLPSAESDGVLPGLVFSSLLFALFHGSLPSLFSMTFLGLTMGAVVIKTGSVLGGILQHILNNFLAVTYLYVLANHDLAASLEGAGTAALLLLLLLALLGYVGSLRMLNRLSPVGSLLENRKRWLPSGWFNWATAVLLIISAVLMAAELLLGFGIVSFG